MENVRKIDVSDLRVGMYVVDTGLSWIDYPLLYSEEGTIADASQLETIVEQGYKHVFIDPERGPAGPVEESPSPGDMAAPGELPDEPAPDKVPIEEEMAVARKLYSDSLRFAHEFLEDVKNGTRIDIKQSERFVDEMIDSVMRNADALVSLSKLRAFDEYTFTHSINVAVLSLAFGKHLKLNREAMQVLGSSALFHDVGKALIPEEILNKPGRLTDEEFAVIKSHPAKGHEIMKKQVGIDKRILRGIAEHHEKINGNGYPRRLSGDKIGLMGKLISLADVYDALASRRVYKTSYNHDMVRAIIMQDRGTHFDPRLVDAFLEVELKFVEIFHQFNE